MLQYYLRAEGLALAWIGTGRLIVSHDYTERDVQAVADRVVAAARAMRADGWFWCPADATSATVRRRILGEIVAARFAALMPRYPERSDRSVRRAADTAATCGTGRHRETGR